MIPLDRARHRDVQLRRKEKYRNTWELTKYHRTILESLFSIFLGTLLSCLYALVGYTVIPHPKKQLHYPHGNPVSWNPRYPGTKGTGKLTSAMTFRHDVTLRFSFWKNRKQQIKQQIIRWRVNTHGIHPRLRMAFIDIEPWPYYPYSPISNHFAEVVLY